MSIVRVYSVFCDVQRDEGARCHGWIAQTTDGATAARREAKAAGWRREDGVDVCPGCHSAAPMPRSSPL